MSEFENKKLTKELLDEVRSIAGFPSAKDEDIIALSNPPYYSACPNPFINDFIERYGRPYSPEKDEYHRVPFAADVSEGKNDPVYNAHSYHTKVPFRAIMRYLLHFTEPGDLVFDGFCGTGMTGIAAQMCGQPDIGFQRLMVEEMPDSKWGYRKAVLCDLSPVATFITYNYNTPVNSREFERESIRILNEIEEEYGWMYETTHVVDGQTQYTTAMNGTKQLVKGKINYTVWSDVFVCPGCSSEIIFFDVAWDTENNAVRKEFPCPHCDALLTKRNLERIFETFRDEALEKTIKRAKQSPVLINYEINVLGKKRGKRFDKKPDKDDLELIKKIEETKIPYWYPTNRMPEGYNTKQPERSHGITHVHHFYTKKSLIIISTVFRKVRSLKSPMKYYLLYTFEQAVLGMAKLSRYVPTHYSQVNRYLSGTLYIGSQRAEVSLTYLFRNKIQRLTKVLKSINHFREDNVLTTTQSATNLSKISSNSIDYIFTDPPFGRNLMYSELNFLWEAWLKVFTNNKKEAIVNKVQRKGLPEYQRLMEQCFKENYRILKPGRWMTVEFHNSQNRVWIAIQEALLRAGFIVADVRTLDKQQGTFKQVTTTSAVKQDLIISSYKPTEGLEANFRLKAGTEEGVWAFVRHHLKHLPIYVEKDDYVEVIAERQSFLLFDRMVAFHVQRGIAVPISAREFYEGLKQRFPIRDDMYFTVEQVHEYDRKRMKAKRVEQVSLFVHDERSAIQWLRRELSRESQTYQDIQPLFIQELFKEKHEDLPELSKLLEQNFLQDDEDKWYIPDSSREADLEKLREKTLLREFQEYIDAKGRLRLFRSEAVRTGFSKCWQEGDYRTIVEVAEKLPIRVLQEEPTLLMYYDNAGMRIQD